MAPRPDGSFEPAGQWSSPSFQEYVPVAPATRKVGDVIHDVHTTEPAASQPPGSDGPWAQQFSLVAFLPSPIRKMLAKTVPSPSYFEAQAERVNGQAGAYHRVSVLKMDHRIAVVVVGSRQAHAATWQVEQVTYPLAPDMGRVAA